MYKSLQAGRAVAASLVVLFHLGGTFAQDKYFGFKALDLPFAWGDAGVEYFFVLSGFLITIAHRADFGRPKRFGQYVAKRVLRIYPTYWLVCLAVCASAVAVPALRQALPSEWSVFVKALLLLPQDPSVVGGTGSPILFVAWSLQYEMMFYAVVGLAVLHRGLGAGAALAFLLVPAGCALAKGCGFPLSFVADDLIFLFAMGVVGACLVQSRLRLPHALFVGVVAIVAFVGFGAFESWHGRDSIAVDRRLVFGAIGAVVIAALARAEDLGTLKLPQRWIRVLGDSSYALYLLHIPVISLLVKLLVRIGVAGPAMTIAAFVGVFLACVGTATVFHLVIERRLLAALRSLVERRPASTLDPADVGKRPQARGQEPSGGQSALGRSGERASQGGR